VPQKEKGEAGYSSIEILQNDSQVLVVLSFTNFDARARLSVKFQSSWDASAGEDHMHKLSLVSNAPNAEALNPLLKVHQFNFSEVLNCIIVETPAFDDLSEWVIVACPPFNQLKSESECCVVPYSVTSRYLVMNKKMYPVGSEVRQRNPVTEAEHGCDVGMMAAGGHDALHLVHHKLCNCQVIKCSADHICVPKTFRYKTRCDQCSGPIQGNSEGLRCSRCNFDVCDRCSAATLAVTCKLQLRACFDQTCFQCKRAAPMFSYFCDKCGSCIPPECVFITGKKTGLLKDYPVTVPLAAGSIQRYRLVKFAAFDSIPVGSEVMITGPSTVFHPSEVLEVVRLEHTQRGPEIIARAADDIDHSVTDSSLLGCARTQRLPMSSIQQVINGTFNKSGGVFVEGSRFTATVENRRIPNSLVGSVVQERETKRLHIEWPLIDCLHSFKAYSPRLLENDEEASQKIASEKQTKAKHTSSLEELRKQMEIKERILKSGENEMPPFFDVLFIGNVCQVFEDNSKLKLLEWELPYFTLIRCLRPDKKNELHRLAEHQICSAVSKLMKRSKPNSKTEAQSGAPKDRAPSGLKKADGGHKVAAFFVKLKNDPKRGTQPKDSSELETNCFSDNMDGNFIFEKDLPLSLKLKGLKFKMDSVCVDFVDDSSEGSVTKAFQAPDSAFQFIKKHSTEKIIVDELVDEFDIEIEFCRELGKYFQVKRFIIQHKKTKYVIGVTLDVDGYWCEVHCCDPRSSTNDELQCFVKHPLSKIISENNRPHVIFTLKSLMSAQEKGKSKLEEDAKSFLQSKGFKVDLVNTTSNEKKESEIVVYFSSLEEANKFAKDEFTRTKFQIKKVSVGTLPHTCACDDRKNLYFINLFEKSSGSFSHRTELEYEGLDTGSFVPQLEYPVSLMPQYKFQLQVARFQRYNHPVAPGVPDLLEENIYFIFYESYRERNGHFRSSENYGKWKYAQVISSSRSRVDGHVVIQEIDCKNQRGALRTLKLWLVECKNPDCQKSELSANVDCTFFHFSSNVDSKHSASQWIDDYCPKLRKCDDLNCGLNHQKSKAIVSSVLSFQILTEPLIFPSAKSSVFLKPNLHVNSEHFSKGFLRPWLPGRVVGIDISKQVYEVKPIVKQKSVSETKKVISTWGKSGMFFALCCENKIEVHYSNGKSMELPNPGFSEVHSCVWISFETLAYGCENGKIYICDLKHSGKQTTLNGHLGAVTCLSPIATSQNVEREILPYFASGSADCDVKLWTKVGGRWQSQVFV
jgi:hypothetical protein